MAILDLLFKTRARIGVDASEEFLPYGAIEFDASLEESHSHSNDVTQFPVESGVDITDHVRKQPDEVTIRGIVTDTPILSTQFLQTRASAVAPRLTPRSLDAYGKALYMLAEGQLVSVVTSLNTYSDMVIESIEVPRDSMRGHAVEMTIKLREIKTASVAVAAGTSDLGTQNTTLVN